MYIEDIIAPISTSFAILWNLPDEDYEILSSFSEQIIRGKTLTTRQAYRLLVILNKLVKEPIDCTRLGIDPTILSTALQNPQWKNTPVASVERVKECRYIGDNILAISIMANRRGKETLHELGAKLHKVNDVYLYLVDVRNNNLHKIINFIGDNSLGIDSSTEEYLNMCLTQENLSEVIQVGNSLAIQTRGSESLTRYLLQHCGAELI
jgi:hypothetical protein